MLELQFHDGGTINLAIAALGDTQKKLSPTAILDDAAAIIISRVRRRFMKMENPDGTRWKPSKAAGLRASGKATRGGDGVKHVGGQTLFCSGRLYHSIQVVRSGVNERKVKTDVPYAGYVHGPSKLSAYAESMNWNIMGVNEEDMFLIKEMIMRRLQV